jgi:hypothetical protein
MGRDVIGLGNAEADAIGPQPGVTGEVPLKVGEARGLAGGGSRKRTFLRLPAGLSFSPSVSQLTSAIRRAIPSSFLTTS